MFFEKLMLIDLSDKAWKLLLESPKFGRNPLLQIIDDTKYT